MSPTVPRHQTHARALWQERTTYAVAATAVACVAYLLLYMTGLVPSQFRYSSQSTTPTLASTLATTSLDNLTSVAPAREEAQRISIDKIGVDTVVKNPVSSDIQTLNNYLAQGAVRWPTSGHPGNGNLFLFGHSTTYETVVNQAYKTFNNLSDLSVGDEITVETRSGVYTYAVIDVQFRRDAEAYIPFDSEADMLTLATCNNFGAKEDRIIVRAEFIGYTPYTS